MTAICTQGLTKHYGAVRALDGLNLNVEAGTVFGFLGPNGAGKTTTIRILTGLARPSAGRAWVAGAEVTADAREVARRIGYLPEEPAFYPWMTPREFLDYIGQIFGLPAGERRARAEDLLGLAGLSEVAGRRIGGFSRGMRQRLGLAQALVNRPEVLLLDEPVSALDPVGRKEVLEMIERLRGQCTVLMSTHILADVERVCDTIGIIARGRLVAEGRREALLNRYAGRAFEIESAPGFEDRLAGWTADLRREGWVASVSLDGNTAQVSAHDFERARRELLAGAVRAGLAVDRFEVVKPSLEDLFLRLVNNGSEAG